MTPWPATTLGRSLLEAEATLLEAALADVFGPELLQVGSWGLGRELLRGARTRRQSTVAATGGAGGLAPDILAQPSHLPIASGSVDAVLLPHTLEIEPDPQAVLREVDRVLVGEGQLVVLGINPLSAWGLRAAASRRGFPPGHARLLPERRLRDWLGLLGYEVGATRHFLYTLPVGSREAGPPPGALRRGLFNPLPAGAWLVKARKRVYGVTPVRPALRRRERLALVGGLVNPTPKVPAE